MAISDEEIIEVSRDIIKDLSERAIDMDFDEAVQIIYNHAIEDAFAFVTELIEHNRSDAVILGLVAQEIRKLLTLRLE